MASSKRFQNRNPGFMSAHKTNDSGAGVYAVLLKQARKSGQLNLSNRSLSEGK